MTRLGFDITAFDFSNRLTAACRKNLEKAGLTAQIFDAPPNSLPEGLGVFDAIIVGRGFFHHIPGRRRRVSFLNDCLAHLEAKAPIFISDFFTREPNSRKYARIQRIASIVRRFQFISEEVELGDWLTEAFQHAFTEKEIKGELIEAGLRPEFYSVSPFSPDSHLAHLVARKNQ